MTTIPARPDTDAVDLTPAEPEVTDMDDFPLIDVGGYLTCGCHGSQREHACGPLD
ncbi:hypothetical protein GCM10010112_43740 [Actinoplanes lobatus]|uniref:Uncharacterized protein n=1 Tax=Actinoplanes lobatus TaxID=113568 RepID=A0A7W7MES9_9ACTN|nr:hypothetical protein [Actinoplanes lobatus]MBB4747587.1 hypothetical protein [Actinoplanes lobatus]GGN74022.1 hypothetical protein GCM10010112_43740 [Actinoplanes lobatus]GIE39852.1 hypothetical protein Alo02nite_27500 [Actinoplanes lobatus]